MKLLLVLLPALLPVAALAQAVHGEMDCKFTGTDFVYDCKLRLARAGQPLERARVSVGAGMPAMPGAHDIQPVVAKPGKAPGEYEAKLDLDMTGEWAVELRVSGPVRDKLILLYQFDERGARPVRR